MTTAPLAVARPNVKIGLGWLVVALGVLAGLIALSSFATSWLPFGENSEGWYLRWLDLAGEGLFGIVFLAASFIAPGNPRRAGVIFLLFLPVTAFSVAYPGSGFLVWHADGGGYFESPSPLTAAGLTLLFFAPFASLVVTFRHRKRAAILFAVFVAVAIPVFISSRWTSVLVPRLAIFSTPFLLFGAFWLGTHRLRWPILRFRLQSVGRRIGGIVVACAFVFCAGVLVAAARAALTSSLFSPDCRIKPPFDHAQASSPAVFTARAVYVGLSIHTMLQMRSAPEAVRDSRLGEWAMGVVQERFWGMPSHWPHVVLMRNYVFWKDHSYFVDGTRDSSLLDRVLPVVEGRIGCSRTQPVEEAIVDLHLLHGNPLHRPAIVGRVRQPGPYAGILTPYATPKFLGGARIDVSGPAGTATIATDASGIYQLEGLPVGEYTVELEVPEGQTVGRYGYDGRVRKLRLKNEDLVEESFELRESGGGAKQQ